MSDGVKFIFKTLFKVPIIIFVIYFVINIFTCMFIYFKVLGASYVVMQTAVENNYLPAEQLNTIYNYVHEIDGIPVVQNSSIIVGVNGGDDSKVDCGESTNHIETGPEFTDDARRKQQYGRSVTVGIYCEYTIFWPLEYNEQFDRSDGKNGVAGLGGMDGSVTSTQKSAAQMEAARQGHHITIPISIKYTVPGLKYYADLNTR